MSRLLVICLSICLLGAACKKEQTAVQKAKAQAVVDDQLIQDYIKQNNLTAVQATDTTTGVWYVLKSPGTGTNIITTSSLVTVGYTARIMTSGKVVSQTENFHPSFTLGNMIKGWQIGLPRSGVKKTGVVRLLVASRYAYGPYEQPTLGLPANSVMDFDIEIFDITN